MATRGRLLIVDDDPPTRVQLAALLEAHDFEVETAADGWKALGKLAARKPELLLTDLVLPGMSGIELLRRAHAADPDCATVIMTGHTGVESAVEAMREGAADYLTKPLDLDALPATLDRVLERQRLRTGTRRGAPSEPRHPGLEALVGSSPAMQRLCRTIRQVAPSRASVLITGESGTGKELVAAAIHELSSRAEGPFVRLHCAALAETLLESELFGHERGAFTGAVNRRHGRFHQADGGTLFLDEIGEISPATQVKLLRFLQEHEFERVGGNETIKVDVRVVAASNRDLGREVREGRFREDLYYRLNVVSLDLPPLRARRGDIPVLAMSFLERYARENGRPVKRFDDEALECLVRYPWPGNVRELENAVERAIVVCRGETVRKGDLAPSLLGEESGDMPLIPGSSLADVERYVILKTLEHTGGCKAQAARILGISHRKIQYKLHEYRDSSHPLYGAPDARPPATPAILPRRNGDGDDAPN